jgi:hypothetical protein
LLVALKAVLTGMQLVEMKVESLVDKWAASLVDWMV